MARQRGVIAGEAVMVLSADDSELLTDLKSAETATKKSATKMQSNLDKVSISAQGTTQAIGTLGTVASSAGTEALSLAADLGVVGGSLGRVGSSALRVTGIFAGASAALATLGKGVAAALTTLLPFAAVIATFGFGLKLASDHAKDLVDQINAMREATERAIAPLKEQIKLLRDRRDISIGIVTQDKLDRLQIARVSQSKREFDLRTAIHNLKQFEVELANKEKQAEERKLSHLKAVSTHRQRQEKDRRQEFAEQQEILRVEEKRLSTEQQRRRMVAQEAVSREQGLTSAAQAILVRTGTPASSFIEDPLARLIAELGERLSRPTRGGISGTFGQRQITSPLGGIRGGEILGKQQLTTAEQNKNINARQLEVAKEARKLLREIAQSTRVGSLTAQQALQLSGLP